MIHHISERIDSGERRSGGAGTANAALTRTSAWSSGAQKLLEWHMPKLALSIALLLPLKLSISYIVLIPSLLLWLVAALPELRSKLCEHGRLTVPLLIFLLVAALCSLFGVNPLRSLRYLASLGFLCCLVMFFAEAARRVPIPNLLAALVTGQAIAAVHSTLDSAFPGQLKGFFLGQVTESGQLGMTVPMALGLSIFYAASLGAASRPTLTAAAGVLNLLGWGFLSFSPSWGTGWGERMTLTVLWTSLNAALAAGACMRYRKDRDSAALSFLLIAAIALPLLCTALLVNLKRGPWMGVLFGSIVLIWVLKRRWVLPIIVASLLAATFLAPVRTRILNAPDHFYISGGRNLIWSIGGELAMRYPLGLGFRNSAFLQNYSHEIPPQLTHFHNNLLNILVETGWIGLAAYLWWLAVLIGTAFRSRNGERGVIALGIGAALLSWQVAGLVEYNFGDSEVVLVAFLLMGVLTALAREKEEGI